MTDEEAGTSALSSLRTISGGAAIFFFGHGVRKVLNLATKIVLTRFLGAGRYGLYAYMTTLFALFRVVTELGSSNSVLHYIPKYEDEPRKQHAVLTLVYLTSLLASGVVAAVVYVSAPLLSQVTLDEPLFVDVLRVGSLVVPFQTLSNITYSVFKSIERMDYAVATSSVVQPLLRLVFVGGALVLGYSLVDAIASLVVSSILTLLVAGFVVYRYTSFGQIKRPSITQSTAYYNYAIPLTFTRLGSFLYKRIDILMIGVLLTETAVGVYNISVTLAGMLMLPIMGFNQLFPPIASRLYHDDSFAELTAVYTTATRWIFTISLLPAIGLSLYADAVLRMFGQEFTNGTLVLILFSVAQFTHAAVGPSGYLLMMTEHQYITSINQFASGILNAILNYVLIIEIGFIGAAVASATVLAGLNIMRVIQVWYLEGIHPYDRTYIKPISAGVVSAVLMYAISLVFERFTLLLVGGTIGSLAFVSILYLAGIENEDKRILKRIFPDEIL